MTNDNRVPAGVPTGGEFATGAKGENADLAVGPLTPEQDAALEALQDKLSGLGNDADDYLSVLDVHKDKARDLVALSIAADAAIEARRQHGTEAAFLRVTDWSDEPDADGSYDVNIAAVCDADGEEIEDLGHITFTSPANSDRPTWRQGVQDGSFDMVSIDALIDSARTAQPYAPPARPTMDRMRAEMRLMDAIENEHICEPSGAAREHLGNQPTIGKGTWTHDGQPAPEGTDPRDAYVKVASSKLAGETGKFPSFIAFSTLADYREKGMLPYYVEVGH